MNWGKLALASGLLFGAQVLHLDDLDLELKLSDIYDRIEVPSGLMIVPDDPEKPSS